MNTRNIKLVTIVWLTTALIGMVYAASINSDGLSGFTWLNSTNLNVDTIYISDELYGAYIIPGSYLFYRDSGSTYCVNGSTRTVTTGNTYTLVNNAITSCEAHGGGELLFAASPGGVGYYEFGATLNITGDRIRLRGIAPAGYETNYIVELKLNGNPGIVWWAKPYPGDGNVICGNSIEDLTLRGGTTNTVFRIHGRQEDCHIENVNFIYGLVCVHFDDAYGSSSGGYMTDCKIQPWTAAGATCVLMDDCSHWTFTNVLHVGGDKVHSRCVVIRSQPGHLNFTERLVYINSQLNNADKGFLIDGGEIAGITWIGGIWEACDQALNVTGVTGRLHFAAFGLEVIGTVIDEVVCANGLANTDIDFYSCRFPTVVTVTAGNTAQIRIWDTDGYITENWGTDQLANGLTLDTFAHGLSGTPDVVQIMWLDDLAGKSWHYSADATNVNVTISAAAGANYDYSYYVMHQPP